MGKLSRLELCNFKSYKGHHALLFGDSYFTSIIGPNGSGKSNSMDAISFVLGIKSSHLRSGQLKDLVYRGRVLKAAKINDDGSAVDGTNDYKNGSADEQSSRNDPKSAWVMAVYEDDAGEEQNWKRTITNQGSSEYRINDRVVSAQQYNEALERENILIKARNFLVFQGDVEAIASQSPQDLTRLIEQISGSLDYKAEYEQRQSKAVEAAENQAFQLHKRRGINSEIKQYQEQKREAENFQNKSDDRDNMIMTQFLWKLYHFQRAVDESVDKINEHKDELQELRRNFASHERTLEAVQKERSSASREASRLERAIKSKEKTIDAMESSLIPVDEENSQSTRTTEAIRQRLESVKKEMTEQAHALQRTKNDLGNVEKAQEIFMFEHKEKMAQQGHQVGDEDRKEYANLRRKVLKETSHDMEKLEGFRRQQRTDSVTLTSLKDKVDGIQAQIQRSEAEFATIASNKTNAEVVARDLGREIEAKKSQFNQVQSERVRANLKRTELEEKRKELVGKLNEALDGRRQNERESRLQEVVASMKRMFPGVRGMVGKLCKPKQKKFDEAVVCALGRDFDSVIVDAEKTGMECVKFLKDKRCPPMTFIPLDNIKVNAINTAVKGILGAWLTIDTIDFDPSLERAMSYACGSSVVCDNLATAKHICYEKGLPVKAVTLDGTVVHKDGRITGGRNREQKAGGKRRFEDNDIPNIQQMVERCEDDIRKLPDSGKRGAVEDGLQSELLDLNKRHDLARQQFSDLSRNHDSKKRELVEAKQALTEREPKLLDVKLQLESITRTVKKFEDAIAKVEDVVFAGFCSRLGFTDIRAYDSLQGTYEQENAEANNKYEMQKQTLKSTLTSEELRHQATKNRVDKLQSQLSQLSQDLKAHQKKRHEIQESLNGEKNELEALHESLSDCKAELNTRNEAVAQARTEVQKRSKDINARQEDINALETTAQKNIADKFALLRRCRMEQIQIPLQRGSLDDLPSEDDILPADPDAMEVDDADGDNPSAVMLDDFGIQIDFDGLDEDLKVSDDSRVEDQLQETISLITSEMEKLNPNMRAIERLEAVEHKLRTATKEYDEARATAATTQEAFDDIKTRRFELFNKAFTHISEQINAVYVELTRSEAYPLGGKAYLDIEDDTNTPYLSGIKYNAMPPLKRYRDMEHLSGGEKTMAALALLFAIHSYHPSPFFVLDEVDAALDNANVDMIKKYIREHAGPGLQFIVISLKSGLFQESESLVGVYRDQEANSSRALTLDLRKYV